MILARRGGFYDPFLPLKPHFLHTKHARHFLANPSHHDDVASDLLVRRSCCTVALHDVAATLSLKSRGSRRGVSNSDTSMALPWLAASGCGRYAVVFILCISHVRCYSGNGWCVRECVCVCVCVGKGG